MTGHQKLKRVIVTKQYIYDVEQSDDTEKEDLGRIVTFHPHPKTEIAVVEPKDVNEEIINQIPYQQIQQQQIDHRKKPKPFVQCPHCGKKTQGLTNHIRLVHTRAGMEWQKQAVQRMMAAKIKKGMINRRY